ncbi:MAG: 2-oxo-4-hydroxy-4-carboxy-5-ureidoimidazoline decarboxylase [Ignavibacteria bacterium]|nr:2-oxo-4-hydroxy-4-carboxy-5-ureidoimidazoline decarboxylase [Ignavibacteria bacterium]
MKDILKKCCGSDRWVKEMMRNQRFETTEDIMKDAERIWYSLEKSDWLEAFDHHPKIGDMNSLKEKFSVSKDLSVDEQAGALSATDETLSELSHYNQLYEKKFGFIFIVFATGKSAEEMLGIIKERINNDPETELRTAAEEQFKITKLRLKNYYESDHNTRT